MLIGICDDKLLFRESLKEICENYISNSSSIDIVCFSSGEEVLAYNSTIDILFLFNTAPY